MITQIALYSGVGILYFLLDAFLFQKRSKRLIDRFFFDIAGINVLALAVAGYAFRVKNIFDPERYTGVFSLKYVLLAVTLMGLVLMFKGFAYDRIVLVKAEKKRPLWLSILITICVTLGTFLVAFSTWLIDFFGMLTPEPFIYNIVSPVVGSSDSMVGEVLSGPILLTACVMMGTIAYLKLNYRIRFSFERIPFSGEGIGSLLARRKVAILLSILFVIGGATYAVVHLRLPEVAESYFSHSTFIQDNYVDIRTTNPKFPEKKRNLIHIYLESVENSYFDKRIGGYMGVNLMPELEALAKEGITFSETEKFGGPYQCYGSSWSVASMVNMHSGMPLKIDIGAHSYGTEDYFLPGIYNLGDFLHDNGYEQTVMFGADADFGGLTQYFSGHGKYKIFDVKYARRTGLIPKDYNVWWGFEDDKLYEFAKDEITRLAKTGKPFNFTMENADTHFPHGYLSKNAPAPYRDHYANVIAYSQREVVKFVHWIQQQDFYKDTMIILTGDHLSMDRDFFADFDPNYHRTTFNLILNSAVQTTHDKNRHYTPMDYYPTIVSGLGITYDGNRLGMGVDLFTGEKTLLEQLGIEKLNSEMRKYSRFFLEEMAIPKSKQK